MPLLSLVVERFAYLPEATLGVLYLPNGEELSTIELPWKDNQQLVSCIPEGQYSLGYRNSPMVTRVTSGRFNAGWEVRAVPDREYIMIHPGNWPSSVQGCITVGDSLAQMKDPKGKSPYGVTNSQEAFRHFMKVISKAGDYKILITAKHAQLTT